MNLLRLHPDDLNELITKVSENISSKLEELIAQKSNIQSLQTFSVKETSKILNTSPSTIFRYLNKGILKGTKKGKDWIITQKNIIDFLDNG